MASRKHQQAVWATGLSLVLHVLVLTGMVLGLKTLAPRPENRAIELRLIPAPQSQFRPEPSRRQRERSNATLRLRPRLTQQPSSEDAITALPGTPMPTPAPNPDAGPKGLLPSLSGRLGCADPAAYRLSREERAACDQRLATAKPAPVGSQFSADELTAFNADKQDPILVRKPHNGCLPRLGNRPSPGVRPARSGASTTFGSGCAWSF